MKTIFNIIIGMFSLLCVTNASLAETFIYKKPEGKVPLFSITFPDDWKIKEEENILYAAPSDELLYFGVRTVKNINTIKTALKEVDQIISGLVKEVEFLEPEKMQIDGIHYWFIDGTGTVKDNENEVEIEVNISVIFFAPIEKTICMVLYFAPPYILEEYMEDLDNIIQSITKLE